MVEFQSVAMDFVGKNLFSFFSELVSAVGKHVVNVEWFFLFFLKFCTLRIFKIALIEQNLVFNFEGVNLILLFKSLLLPCLSPLDKVLSFLSDVIKGL